MQGLAVKNQVAIKRDGGQRTPVTIYYFAVSRAVLGLDFDLILGLAFAAA